MLPLRSTQAAQLAPPAATCCHRKKAATALKGVVGVGAVDADAHKELAGNYEVRVRAAAPPPPSALPQSSSASAQSSVSVQARPHLPFVIKLELRGRRALLPRRACSPPPAALAFVIKLELTKSEPFCPTRPALPARPRRQGFPTLLLMATVDGKPKVVEKYSGGRTAKDIVPWVLQKVGVRAGGRGLGEVSRAVPVASLWGRRSQGAASAAGCPVLRGLWRRGCAAMLR